MSKITYETCNVHGYLQNWIHTIKNIKTNEILNF